MSRIILLFLLILPFLLRGQVIKGVVMNASLNGFPKAVVKEKNRSTRTDSEGRFVIRVDSKFPHYLTFSALGYETEILRVDNEGEEVSVVLKDIKNSDILVQSASRTSEKVLESPVTVGRLSIAEVEYASSNSFYEELGILKGVNKLESGFNFQAINTRGFAAFNNTRFVQLVDGCDNALPALNYSEGNINGVSDLDIAGVEILHGASSALYGANAYNGIVLLSTKNPFDHPGVALKLKSGVSSQNESGVKPFYDTSFRIAHQFNSFFAAKLNYTYRDSEEWHANDLRGVNDIGIGEVVGYSNNKMDYNGLNIYGDELVEGVIDFDKKLTKIRRIGYHEKDLISDFRSTNRKISTLLHFRFFELVFPIDLKFGVKYSKSSSIEPFGGSKLVNRDFEYSQINTEIQAEDFYVRAYHTNNDAGRTYDLGGTAHYLNKYIDDKNKNEGKGTFADNVKRHIIASHKSKGDAINFDGNWYKNHDITNEEYRRAKQFAYMEQGNLDTKSTDFGKLLKTITDFHHKGSRLYDKSYLNHIEGNYNFKWLLYDWCDFQVGGSYREYTTDTDGTILNDFGDNIKVNEYAAYTQFQKSILDERLKVTSSLRFDKSKNFKGNFSPRLALNLVLGKNKNHVFRVSYQSAFRNPSIQEQYMNRFERGFKTIGFIQANLDRILIKDNTYKNINGDVSFISGDKILNNSVVAEKLKPTDGSEVVLEKNKYTTLMNESVNTFELGYRSMIDLDYRTRVDIDFDAFYSVNKNFIHRQKIAVSTTGHFYPNGDREISKKEIVKLTSDIYEYKDSKEEKLELELKDLVKNKVQIMDIDAYLDLINGNEKKINILVNSKTNISSYGFGLSLISKFADKYDVGFNYSYINFNKSRFKNNNLNDYGFYIPPFNTPKHTFKANVGANGIMYNLGFKLDLIWQDSYQWIGSVKSEISSRTVLNGNLNYMIPSLKSTFKLGGTNLMGKDYEIAPGLGNVGRTYYLSWIIEN